jgi:energy-coupling factor transporter ATP-binding protein EcfA2
MAIKKHTEPTLSVKNFAQIREGSVTFGDLTLFVGAQASGKSIFLQLLKLLVDKHQIFDTLQIHAYDWGGDFNRLIELYYGESMSAIRRDDTVISFEGKVYTREDILNRKGVKESSKEEKMFYIPAQRVLTLSQGWPRPFNSYDTGDPYVIKSFSETLRVLMEKEFSNGQGAQEHIFPKAGKMSESIRERINDGIFHGATVELDKDSLRRRFLLRVGESRLPFMTWSAGQKEFMPLLLSLYHLIPSGIATKKENIDWVVIEEPEMGLHPQAIQTVMLLALQLIQRGYKVVISTHSPVLLELVWVINNVKNLGGNADDLFKLFNIKNGPAIREIFQDVINLKAFTTWYFERKKDGVHIQDISTLDAGSDDPDISNWGGLSEFASRAVEVVSKLAAT